MTPGQKSGLAFLVTVGVVVAAAFSLIGAPAPTAAPTGGFQFSGPHLYAMQLAQSGQAVTADVMATLPDGGQVRVLLHPSSTADGGAGVIQEGTDAGMALASFDGGTALFQ